MREIGSEYWCTHNTQRNITSNNEKYLLSGRTALHYIINDIKATRLFRKVLLPAYCCESMIQPFIAEGIEVEFYNIDCDVIDYPYINDVDVILLLDYFGYQNSQNGEIAKSASNENKIIIYDSTHKINGNLDVQCYADYSFCSYRKWFYCNFAKVTKHKGAFNNNCILKTNEEYIRLRDRAAEIKREYISGAIDNKDEFLSLFSTAEDLLGYDYKEYAGNPVSFNIDDILLRRSQNASYLINELKKIPQISMWRNEVTKDDAPMFVPILVNSGDRNNLRDVLIKNRIYCPVHWPKPTYIDSNSRLYDMELSIVCDQRYNLADMDRIIQVIKNYFSA